MLHRKTARSTAVARLIAVPVVVAGAACLVTQVDVDAHAPSAPTAADAAAAADIAAARTAAGESSRSTETREPVSQALSAALTTQQAEAYALAEAKERAAAEEAARKKAEEEAARKAAEEEAARQAAEEEAARKAAEEEAAREAEAARAAAARAKAWVLPVADYRITAGFGSSGGRWSSTHTGLDFAAPSGTAVRSAAAGTVTFVEWDGAYGNKVAVRHSDGTVTWYGHLSAFEVSVGAGVDSGQVIGRVGSTGNSTGPHLHFEVRPGDGDAVDPRSWLADHGLRV